MIFCGTSVKYCFRSYPLARLRAHVRLHTHLRANTRLRTHARAFARACARVRACALLPACARLRTSARLRTLARMRALAYVRASARAPWLRGPGADPLFCSLKGNRRRGGGLCMRWRCFAWRHFGLRQQATTSRQKLPLLPVKTEDCTRRKNSPHNSLQKKVAAVAAARLAP